MFADLNESNVMLYSAQNYYNPHCFDTKEFLEDVRRVKYIKKLFKKFRGGQELKERLILNHMIIINNMFGPVASTRILFLYLSEYQDLLKPFLIYLNLMPQKIESVNGKEIDGDSIIMDQTVVDKLRKL